MTKKPFLPVLHGMRGLASVLVVMFHAWHMGMSETLHSPLLAKGYLWVDFFFLLSGFIIAYHYETLFAGRIGRRQIFAFYALRAARIFPMHWVVLLLWMAIEFLQLHCEGRGFDKDREWVTFLPNALLLQSWLFQDSSWNPPSWSISCEWFFYLAFPMLAVALARRSLKFSLATMMLMAGALVLAAYYFYMLFPGELRLGATSNGGIFRALPEFVIGMCICNIAAQFPAWIRTYGRWIFCISGLFTLIVMLFPISDFLVVAGFTGMVFGGAGMQGTAPKPMRFLGDVSYSVYILHSIVIGAVGHFLPVRQMGLMETLAVGAGLLAVVLVCSAITYRVVEKPCQRWAKQRFGRVLPH